MDNLEDLHPGQDLNAGMFKERTIQEVLRIRSILRDREHTSADTHITTDYLLNCLEELSDLCMDRDVLHQTAIGKEMNQMRKHANPAVAQKAESLVNQWKKDFAVREQVVDGFAEKGSLKRRDARELEEGLFNTWCPLGLLEGEGYRAYQRHYKRLCTHLRNRDAGSLVQRLQDKQLSCSAVATLPDFKLLSEERRQQQKATQAECLKATLLESNEVNGTATEEYICPKCQSTRCVYAQLQTGWHNDSQDLTVLVKCLECGERWKAHDDHGLAGS